MSISLIVFDLDGTLISSHQTIYKATIHSLNEFGIKVEIPEKRFYEMIGWHFEDIFKEFGFKVSDFEEFISVYKNIYFDYIGYSYVYEGVEKTLFKLIQNNYKISLLTTKGQDQAERLINHFNLSNYFHYIMGRRPGLAHKPSPQPLLKICEDLNVDVSKTLIVGDTELDIQCGKNANAKTCAVTYGYRKKEMLESLSPDFIVNDFKEIEKIL